MNITVHESRILEKSDYYPFGLTFNEYKKGGMIGQRFKYNGKEEINDLGVNWQDYGARMYDAALGRWNHVDPLAELMVDDFFTESLMAYSLYSLSILYFIASGTLRLSVPTRDSDLLLK